MDQGPTSLLPEISDAGQCMTPHKSAICLRLRKNISKNISSKLGWSMSAKASRDRSVGVGELLPVGLLGVVVHLYPGQRRVSLGGASRGHMALVPPQNAGWGRRCSCFAVVELPGSV